MKEIMSQYGQSLVTVIIALLLILVIAAPAVGSNKTIYAAVGQTIERQNEKSETAENMEFERYWRLR